MALTFSETPAKSLRDYVAILRRRSKPMLTAFFSMAAVGLLVAVVLPPVYRSTATILIEEQAVPQDLVRSTITTYADQRIETIKQHVLSRATLWGIVTLAPRKLPRARSPLTASPMASTCQAR